LELLLILALIIVSYIIIRFINRVLYILQHPPFDNEIYHKTLIETLNKYREHEGPTRIERLKKANAELKHNRDIRQVIEKELNIEM